LKPRGASRRDVLASGVAAVASFATSPARSQPAPRDGIADALLRDMAQWKVPGASYAVIANGKVSLHAFGVRRAGSTFAVTPQTMFQAASLSKTLVAATALVLVERGRLTLDSEINDHLTIWKLPASPLAEGRLVTLRRLLAMTAGINEPGYPGYRPGSPLPSLVQILDGTPPANSAAVRIVEPPGTKEIYSGGGYEIAQAAIESAAGARFARVARDTVLAPAGMTVSGFDQPLLSERATNVAVGHTREGAAMIGGGNVFPELAAAGLWSTPAELARFLVALWEARRRTPGALLAPATIDAMLTPVDGFGYGLGAALRGSGRDLVLMKRGHNIGFHSYMMLFPETGHGAVVMTNAESGDRVIEPLLRRIAERGAWPPFGPLAD
jgi:CubicO group peptidase (beta-lactamase class C family)